MKTSSPTPLAVRYITIAVHSIARPAASARPPKRCWTARSMVISIMHTHTLTTTIDLWWRDCIRVSGVKSTGCILYIYN